MEEESNISKFFKKFLPCFFIISIFVLGAVFLFLPDEERDALHEKQSNCKHDWYELDSSLFRLTIYCPKCKLEDIVTPAEWSKINIDLEYEKEGAKE